MRKILSVVFILSVLLSLSACGGGRERPKDREETQGTEETLGTVETTEETQEPILERSPETILENDQCRVTVMALEPGDSFGYGVKVSLENKSRDITYMFAVDHSAVNGVMCNAAFAQEVSPGEVAEGEILLPVQELKPYGIARITDIALGLHVFDTNDWTAEAAGKGTFHVYPYGEEEAEYFDREPAPEDQLLVRTEEVTAVALGYVQDELWGYGVEMFFVNDTDIEVMFSTEDNLVNGCEHQSFFSVSLAPGCSAFKTLYISNEELEDNGISQVEQLEFTLKARNANGLGDDICRESVLLEP